MNGGRPEWQAALRSAPTAKRIRAYAGGRVVADSQRARIVWFGPVARTYAVPVEDLRGTVGGVEGSFDDVVAGPVPAAPLRSGDAVLRNAVLVPHADAGLGGEVILNWQAMDAWFEEDDEVFVHPHDPMHRLDVRTSRRHLVVEVAGERVAETRRPTLLFETDLPTRYYVPALDVTPGVLKESATKTACAYKGFATHFTAVVGGKEREDVAWTYRTTFLEAAALQGLVAFYQERTDFILDGERLPRPATPWRRDD